jgi:hypothetical protein
MHLIGFQILLWQTPSACEAMQLPVSAEGLEGGLEMAYAPLLALSRRFFPYQQYNPASVVVAIAFSIIVSSIIITAVLVIIVKRNIGSIVPDAK